MLASLLTTPQRGAGEFLTTRWSRVLLAGQHGEGEERATSVALTELCRDYWRPLYSFARRSGFGQEDAEDLTQGFMADLIERHSIGRADPERGRFRTFLLGAFQHYLLNFRRGMATAKRGGLAEIFSIDSQSAEQHIGMLDDHGLSPAQEFERNWAISLLEKVMLRLGEDYTAAGRADLFATLRPYLSSGERPGFAALGATLGLSEGAMNVALHRLRKRYGVLLREEIAATLTHESEVQDELHHLMRVVSGERSAFG